MAFEQPNQLGGGRRPNILRFQEQSPIVRFSITDFPEIDNETSSAIFMADTFVKDSEVLEMDYAANARYRALGTPSGTTNPDVQSAADMIATLDVDIFDYLRRLGLLIIDNKGGYYLMSQYSGSDIEDLLVDIIKLRRAYIAQTKKAMSQNGLKAGVTEGRILNIESYLSSHNFNYHSLRVAFLETLDRVNAENFMEYRLNNLIPKEA